MILTTTDNINGKNLEMLGIVKGGIVQTKHVGRDIMASFKTVVGGEVKSYTQMMEEARATATTRMIAEAQALQADAIVGVRYGSSTIMGGSAEIIAYGTAVKFL